MSLGVHRPSLLAYVCWLKDAIGDEEQAHQAQGYPEEGILEWAQHQQLELLPEGSRGLGTWAHRPPTPRQLSSPSLGSWAEAWLPSDTKMVKWMGTQEEARMLRALATLLLASHSFRDQNAAF